VLFKVSEKKDGEKVKKLLPLVCTVLLSLYFLLGAQPWLWGQVEVEITPPKLEEGMAQIEGMVTTEIQSAAAEIAELADSLLTKPSLYTALGDAGAAAASLYPFAPQLHGGGYYVGIGSSAGIATERYNYKEMKEKVENVRETDDFYLGAGLKPLELNFAVPGDFIFPQLGLMGSFAYISGSAQEYTLNSIGATLSAGYPLLPACELGPYVTYSGVQGSAGVSVLRNTLSTHFYPGIVRETVDFDPLGEDAPLFTQSVTIEVEPDIVVDVESTVYALSLELAGGFKVIEFLHFTLGASGELVFGNTSVGLAVDEEIQIIGYLSELVDEPSRLVVSGSTEPIAPSTVQFSLFTSLSWQVGTYVCTLPVSWRSNGLRGGRGGFAAGLFLGVHL